MTPGEDRNGDTSHAGSSFQSESLEGFSSLESGILVAYRNLYERIFWDLEQASTSLDSESCDFADLIHAAAHLRLTLEEVTIASFVANHALLARARTSVRNANDFDSARKALRKLNPHYWPVSFGPVTHGSNQGLGVRQLGLAEGDIGPCFGVTSELLHAANPYRARKRSPEEYLAELRSLRERLQSRLESHVVQMAGEPEYVCLWVEDGTVCVRALRTTEPLLGAVT